MVFPNELTILEGCPTNKADAVAVLHEISQVCREINTAEIVADRLGGSDEYELKIKCVLSLNSRKSLNEILQKRNLTLQEENGRVFISSPIHSDNLPCKSKGSHRGA